jgi:catechol 2,3-dioxygenase-like lactoylglutathione lyase family enzyme
VATVSVRYIADDVDAAVAFYVERLGFDVEMRPAPGFAMLARGDLRPPAESLGQIPSSSSSPPANPTPSRARRPPPTGG